MPAIVEMARSMRAKKLMVVGSDDDGQFHVNQEMNGKLIRLTVPAGCEKPSHRQKIIVCRWPLL